MIEGMKGRIMWLSLVKKATIASFVLTAALMVPTWCANSDTHTALPGTLNYLEGQASIGNEALNAKSVGSTELQAGQTLTTENGKAEILLTPGVFFRLGNGSSAEMGCGSFGFMVRARSFNGIDGTQSVHAVPIRGI